MSKTEIIEEIKIELENLSSVIEELHSILEENKIKEPSLRDKTAAGSFLAQFYNGVENILKRISKLKDTPLPKGELWHVELFKRFCQPPYENLPLIFNKELADIVNPYRKFRHIIHHGYGFQLKWEMMKEGIEQVEYAFAQFSARIDELISNEFI